MKILLGFVIAIGVGLGVVLILMFGGYNVAASEPHSSWATALLHTTMRHSVERRAAEIQAPASFSDAELREGFVHFDAMCVECHGAPGVERGEAGQGLQPRAPSLAKAAERWSPSELFWIVKHGIRMTGMPAFGSTHSDEQLLGLVAVVKRLPQLDAAGYQALVRATAGSHHDSLDGSPQSHEHHGSAASSTAPAESAGNHHAASPAEPRAHQH